jgi:predicted permease
MARLWLEGALMRSLLQDLRFALRMLGKSPGFTVIALVTIAIGTGANATVFGFVNALLLRPAPGVADAGSLVAIYTSDYSSGPYGSTSYPDYESLKAGASAFTGMAAEYDRGTTPVAAAEGAERVRTLAVTGNYFDLLGVRAAYGRMLAAIDMDPSATPAAVVGYHLWQRAFHADPALIGTSIVVGGRTHTIVGVAPERFDGLDLGRAIELWVPLRPPPADPRDRQNRSLAVVARLRPDASLREAETQVAAIATQLARDYPETNLGTLAAPKEPRPMFVRRHSRIDPSLRSDVAMVGGIIMSAVGLVLLMACANVANLLLSRGTVRRREMAIRLALGAGRARLVRQLFTESLLLGTVGGCAGLLMSMWTSDVLPSFFPAEQARMLETSLDGRVIAFTGLVSIACSLLFGLAPAWQAVRPNAASTLRGDPGRSSDGPQGMRLRRVLVGAQVALAVVLLVASALLAQSLTNALDADPGFGTRHAVLASVELPGSTDEAARVAYFNAAVERVQRVAGVEAVSLVRTRPLTLSSRRGFFPEGYSHRPGEDRELRYNIVGDEYFDVMRIPLLAGRRFSRADQADTAQVVIVNHELARRYFTGDPIGKHLRDSSGRVMEIVGVVKTDARISIEEAPGPAVYYPLSQFNATRMTIVARTSSDATPAVEAVRRELVSLDRGVPVFGTMTLAAHISTALASNRLTAALVSVCGGMALLLAVVGSSGCTG